MKKIFTENLGLKALSIVISFFLWLIVVNYDDPVISATYNGVPVNVINNESLTGKGKVYSILDNTDNVSVTVKGRRSIVESMEKDDILATADLNDLTLMDTVAINVSTTRNVNQLDSITCDKTALELHIENLSTLHLPLEVETSGEPAEGYIVGDSTPNQNTIRVSGAESIVNNIKTAKINVNVSDRTSDINTSSDVMLLDEDGVLVNTQNLDMNIRTINVNVTILPQKAVDIIYAYSGEAAEGYAVKGDIIADRAAVYIAGRESVLEKVSSIEIPATAINIDGKNSTLKTVIDIKKYLPEGIRIAEEFDGNVAVRVDIEKRIDKVLNVPMHNISIVNLPDGYSASIRGNVENVSEGENNTIMLKVPTSGVADSYFDVNGDGIFGTIDVGAYLEKAGKSAADQTNYQMEITYLLPIGITQTEVCYADVLLYIKVDDMSQNVNDDNDEEKDENKNEEKSDSDN